MELIPLVFIVVIFVGVWGSMIVSARVKQMTGGPTGDLKRFEELEETHRLLEARLERVEEQLAFFGDLYAPDLPRQLDPGESGLDDQDESADMG